jgi:hypothetical protein
MQKIMGGPSCIMFIERCRAEISLLCINSEQSFQRMLENMIIQMQIYVSLENAILTVKNV